ncbi:NmrA family NAD(P)-binding protein [uncultured Tateyamaria sp.]|uniref:NmrA family NAD(P)-binding protein n=1 Tax=uncultured Tateyamaria sp. TaxID=455651 RepID=UPI00262179BF|nr:NmrA family NAD(P)-binding protein [uncultured Tateyamaria sp.]
MPLKILAYGANGAQMSAGTQALVDAGHAVRAFTRSPKGAERWQAAGVDAFTGDMADLDALRRASEGQDALFMHVPLITDPNDDRNAYGLNALRAAKDAGITRVVWNTGGPIMDPSSTTDPGAVLWRTLQEDGFSFLGLVPITYMENLLGPWTMEGLRQGKLLYPTPEPFKMQWGAAADFGRVADKALQGDLPNEVLRLGGPAALDGDDLARIMGEALRRDLTYDVMTPAAFEAQLSIMAGARVAGMIAGMYGGVQANPDQFQPGFLTDPSEIEARFDLKLTSFADWVSDHRLHFTQQG